MTIKENQKEHSAELKDMVDKGGIERHLAAIERVLPPIVFRNWTKWGDIIPISPRTVANDDCLGIGPKEKLYLGRVVGYPRCAFMEYLRSKSHMTPKRRL